jgi:hypothetical protein
MTIALEGKAEKNDALRGTHEEFFEPGESGKNLRVKT